jgi:hypothetical protein
MLSHLTMVPVGLVKKAGHLVFETCVPVLSDLFTSQRASGFPLLEGSQSPGVQGQPGQHSRTLSQETKAGARQGCGGVRPRADGFGGAHLTRCSTRSALPKCHCTHRTSGRSSDCAAPDVTSGDTPVSTQDQLGTATQ